MKRRISDDELDPRLIDMRVRAANEEEFRQAIPGGYCYGYLERDKLPVYVILGKEVKNKSFPFLERYRQTKYKYFRHCEVRVAETDELLDEKDYSYIFKETNVILIY